uniref:sigma-70 family RNA polymerase sigma factor n=1 Tax=Pedobacter schmidteae TaxID=2201271 RepID=UPI000EB15B78|nr:sigma-70 family RNA polymerase sigma factor [Pedobacter schmidteae]
MLKIEETLTANNSAQLRELYNNYGAMLLGYIMEVIKDKKIAEAYFLKIFTHISKEIESSEVSGIYGWPQIFRYTRHRLATYANPLASHPSGTIKYKEQHPALHQLTDEQRKIFCDAYYYGKTTDAISIELNQPEALIRKTLREAFIIIRTGSGN